MKKIFLVSVLLPLLLSACGTSSNPTQAGPSSSTESLPLATQLIVGSLQLRGSQQEVTAEQAAELLPLWQVYSDLIASGSAAQEEIDGLTEQIQEAMTKEQLQAITDMNLTQRDVFTLMRENGDSSRQSSQGGNNFGNQDNGNRNFGPPDGGVPGGFEGDGQNFIPNGNGTAQPNQSAEALQARQQTMTTALLKSLIEYLQSRISS
jgi:hypothetical protein